MRRHSNLARAARTGFTLVELLVVIAIIAVLISLLLPATFKIRDRVTEARARHDITQMQTSIGQFTSKNSVDFIPSRIVLREDGQYGTHANSQMAQAEMLSLAYLKRLWPRLVTGPACLGHDWNGDGQITVGDQGSFALEGDQCIVFFLGGIQVGGSCQGFAVNKQYPANINQSLPVSVPKSNNEPSFMDFPTDRLQIFADTLGTGRTNQFRSFLDQWDSPIAYFSSRGGFGGAINGYNADCSGIMGGNGVGKPGTINGGVPSFYCEGRSGQGMVKAFNRDAFQIILAGKDKTFGSPFQNEMCLVLNPALGQRCHDYEQPGVPAPNGKPPYVDAGAFEAHADDLSNFHQMALGAGTQ